MANKPTAAQLRLASKLLALSSATTFDESTPDEAENKIRAGAAKWAEQRLAYYGLDAGQLRNAAECVAAAMAIK